MKQKKRNPTTPPPMSAFAQGGGGNDNQNPFAALQDNDDDSEAPRPGGEQGGEQVLASEQPKPRHVPEMNLDRTLSQTVRDVEASLDHNLNSFLVKSNQEPHSSAPSDNDDGEEFSALAPPSMGEERPHPEDAVRSSHSHIPEEAETGQEDDDQEMKDSLGLERLKQDLAQVQDEEEGPTLLQEPPQEEPAVATTRSKSMTKEERRLKSQERRSKSRERRSKSRERQHKRSRSNDLRSRRSRLLKSSSSSSSEQRYQGSSSLRLRRETHALYPGSGHNSKTMEAMIMAEGDSSKPNDKPNNHSETELEEFADEEDDEDALYLKQMDVPPMPAYGNHNDYHHLILGLVRDQVEAHHRVFHPKRLLGILVGFVLILSVSNFGTSWAAMTLVTTTNHQTTSESFSWRPSWALSKRKKEHSDTETDNAKSAGTDSRRNLAPGVSQFDISSSYPETTSDSNQEESSFWRRWALAKKKNHTDTETENSKPAGTDSRRLASGVQQFVISTSDSGFVSKRVRTKSSRNNHLRGGRVLQVHTYPLSLPKRQAMEMYRVATLSDVQVVQVRRPVCHGQVYVSEPIFFEGVVVKTSHQGQRHYYEYYAGQSQQSPPQLMAMVDCVGTTQQTNDKDDNWCSISFGNVRHCDTIPPEEATQNDSENDDEEAQE